MNSFVFMAPTKMYFGQGQIKELPAILKPFGRKVLLVYGGGSIKKNGIYDEVQKLLADFTLYEVAGVHPNPRIESVRKGAALCKEHNIDVVLAVGGGSTVDCSKAIAAAACYDGEAWDLACGKAKIEKALPVVDIITLSATGSEMNNTAVISNRSENLKLGIKSEHLFPKASILDPTYTYSVSAYQTASGTVDIMSHIMEAYFNDTEGANVQEELAHGLLRNCIKYGPIALEKPDDYEARANLMWGSTMALNGLVGAGFACSWSCHAMEHVLSAMFDVTHGAGLAILTPSWMRYVLDDTTVSRFKKFGVHVWGIDSSLPDREIAEQAIDKTEEFFTKTLKLPATLTEVGVEASKFEEMAEIAVSAKGGTIPGWRTLTKEDVVNIYKMCE